MQLHIVWFEFKDYSGTLIDGLVYHFIQVSGRTKHKHRKKSGTILKGNHVTLQAVDQEFALLKGSGRERQGSFSSSAEHGAEKSNAF